MAGKVAGLAESNEWMTYGHLQADCLYSGISSEPNARYRVWEAFTFTLPFLFVVCLSYYLGSVAIRKNLLNINIRKRSAVTL